MTTTSNISVQQTTGVTNTPKAQDSRRSQSTLDFIDVILNRAKAAQAGKKSQATDDIAAKVAEFIYANPADQAGLQKLLQSFMPEASDKTLQELAAFLQPVESTANTGLISDLTAQLATDIQQEVSIEDQVAQTLEDTAGDINGDDMAAILSQIEPGSAAKDTKIDPELLAKLQAKFEQFKAQGGKPEDFKDDVVAFLKDEGVAGDEMRQYLAVMAQKLRESSEIAGTAPVSVIPTTNPAIAQRVAEGIVKDDKRDTSMKNAAASLAGKHDAAPAPQAAVAAAAKQTQTPTHPSVINSLLGAQSDNSIGVSFGETGGFGGDMGSQGGQTATGNATDASLMLKDAQGQGFSNYMAAARGTQSPATQMVAMQISRNANSKVDTFTMQLNPIELGALEVRMKFGKDGTMKAHLIAEKPETLSMLQKDSAQLERILQQSGINIEENALSFDLREQNRQPFYEREQNNASGGDAFAAYADGGAEKTIQAKMAVETYGYITQSGVDIRV